MAHLRTSIRSAVATRLTGLTTSGARCYPSRIQPLADANLPCLRVYLDEETVEPTTVHDPSILHREVTIRVECCAKAVSNLDSTLDTMLAEVETAIGTGDASFGGTIKSRPFLRSVEIELDDTLEKPVGILRAEYLAHYFTTAANPAAAI